MRPSRPFLLHSSPRLIQLMSLMFLAGLAGCGPASSDNASSPRTNPVASAASSATASPAPLASENKTGSVPASSTKPVNPMDVLDIPEWIAKDLASTNNVDTRLRALETLVLNAPVGSIGPLILAFGDDEEPVRKRAMELMEQDAARAAEAGE